MISPVPHVCAAPSLRVALEGRDGSAGHLATQFSFRNTSTQACTLKGYPLAVFLDARRQPLATQFQPLGGPARPLLLKPGAKAYFYLRYGDKGAFDPGKCPPDAAWVRISAPGSRRYVTLKDREYPCRQATISPVSLHSWF